VQPVAQGRNGLRSNSGGQLSVPSGKTQWRRPWNATGKRLLRQPPELPAARCSAEECCSLGAVSIGHCRTTSIHDPLGVGLRSGPDCCSISAAPSRGADGNFRKGRYATRLSTSTAVGAGRGNHAAHSLSAHGSATCGVGPLPCAVVQWWRCQCCSERSRGNGRRFEYSSSRRPSGKPVGGVLPCTTRRYPAHGEPGPSRSGKRARRVARPDPLQTLTSIAAHEHSPGIVARSSALVSAWDSCTRGRHRSPMPHTG